MAFVFGPFTLERATEVAAVPKWEDQKQAVYELVLVSANGSV